MTGLEDRMIRVVWHVVEACGSRRHAEAVACRILRDNFTPAGADDPCGREVRGRLVRALRMEFGVLADGPVDRARVRDELVIRQSRGVARPVENLG